jgi:lipopolysaccharide assembly outer membrane protein LptD (OstA)
MKYITFAAFVLLSVATIAVWAASQQPTFQAVMTRTPQQKQIGIVAQSIQRGGGVTHATGNVRVRITSIPEGEDRTVIQAQEVIYHGDTGEIETRGDARIAIEKLQ